MRPFAAAALTAAALSCARFASAAPAATVEHAEGKVERVRPGDRAPLKKGAALEYGDSVATAAGAWAVLKLADGSRIKLKDESLLALEPPGQGTRVRLDLGGLFASVLKRKGRDFTVRSRGAVAAVRGTTFFAAYGRDSAAGSDLWLCVKEGSVAVKPEGAAGEVLVRQGEGILVEPGKGLPQPQRYKWTEGLNWNMDPGKGSIVDATDAGSVYGDPLDKDYD